MTTYWDQILQDYFLYLRERENQFAGIIWKKKCKMTHPTVHVFSAVGDLQFLQDLSPVFLHWAENWYSTSNSFDKFVV